MENSPFNRNVRSSRFDKKKGLLLGGSIAGFFVVGALSWLTFFKPEPVIAPEPVVVEEVAPVEEIPTGPQGFYEPEENNNKNICCLCRRAQD
ncbi:MAG: hypothetical protein AAB845_03415, partial [Patescibacteria group bacterium]